MLAKQTMSANPPATVTMVITLANDLSKEQSDGSSRFTTPIDTVIPSAPLPEWVDAADYLPLRNGGYTGIQPDTYAKSDTPVDRTFSSTPADPFVRISTTTYYEGVLYGQTSVGDGVTPFPVPPEPNPQFASTVQPIDIKYPGSWREVHTLEYQSGHVEVYDRSYVVEGDPSTAFDDAELYVAGLPTPVYKAEWQAVADFWSGRDELKRAAAQAKADAAGDPPVDPYSESLQSADGTAPADIQQAQSIATTGQTASAAGITAYESLADTNPVQATLNELSSYMAIVQSWENLASSTTNANLKSVAQKNREWTFTFMDLSREAHNGRVPFSVADQNWQLYELYSAWVLNQPANSLVDIRTWDQDLGQP